MRVSTIHFAVSIENSFVGEDYSAVVPPSTFVVLALFVANKDLVAEASIRFLR